MAVIGASRREGSIGHKIFTNLLDSSFRGPVIPVNPKADAISGVKTYSSVLDIPEPVDLAVIVVPAETVLPMVEGCGRKGVKAVIVISAGFAESGVEGIELQEKLTLICRHYGMKLVGPNCMGVMNTDPSVNLNATFSHVFPPQGKIAMATDSGALGLVILEYASNLGIGLSNFASVGNRADVSSNDLLEYWRDDPGTSAIMLYLEAFGNPKNFIRLARSISPNKPIIALKSGRSSAGSRAAASHTGALATVDVAVDALFAQGGILRVDNLERLFDVADILSRQPIPRGSRVAVLTNGGGPGALTADACAAAGLELPSLAEKTLQGLKALLPARASLGNPIDITDVGAPEYQGALRLLAADNNIDAVIVIFIPPVFACPEDVAAVIREMEPEFRRRGKPLLASFMGKRGCVPGTIMPPGAAGVPSFSFPEAAVYALARARDYGLIRNQPAGRLVNLPGIDRGKARRIVESAGDGWLPAKSVFALLTAYGIKSMALRFAEDLDAAIGAAEDIGYPVALKLDSATIVHKTEVGGVALDIGSSEELRAAYHRMLGRLAAVGRAAEVRGVTVQKMAGEGVELIAGITRDETFGPLILFGLGGIYTELFEDRTLRIQPLTDKDAQEMVRSVRAFKLLEGFRGEPPADVPAVEELLLRLSAMAEDLPRIKELDLNPIRAFTAGKSYTVVDARILIE
ncbi:acetate--CoA ligase family protein [Dehalogenimonas alkenigignens]|uniref:acetate--CoA ligase family protein n=1 Tax=Dehalogenimonas alkenigignens TaxID=1217799 RepID=UPI00073088BD|nr:acetate--CoA ligase [Dehalogenimonas alkenigignens]